MKKDILQKLYIQKKLSSIEIAKKFKCSEHKVNYWLGIYKIKKRTISEAIYQKNNPKGDPFLFVEPKKINDVFLFGLGLGLFWGEGTKKDSHTLKLSNSDPNLIKKYLDFLIKIYNINKNKLRFEIQTYNDIDPQNLMIFWRKVVSVKKNQFYKTTILTKRGEGTYHTKMKYGVLVVHFNNIKLRNLICSQIANMATI